MDKIGFKFAKNTCFISRLTFQTINPNYFVEATKHEIFYHKLVDVFLVYTKKIKIEGMVIKVQT